MKNEIISFVLPGAPYKANGGHKIVFEYANKLCNQGYIISIYFLCDTYLKNKKIPEIVRKEICRFLVLMCPKWIKLNKKIKKVTIFSITNSSISNANHIFATSVNTAYAVSKLCAEKGKKYYLIQGYENWFNGDAFVNKSYLLGMKNITISHYLWDIVNRIESHNLYLVINAIDTNKYRIIRKIDSRNKYVVGALYHDNPIKGFEDTFYVIQKLKTIYPKLRAKVFGVSKRPKYFPDWIEYTQNASEEETIKLYNEMAIFISSSKGEGFGLTSLEAMACGVAVVTTRSNGVKEYAIDGYNSLMSDINDKDEMVKNVKKLIDNDELRKSLVYNGVTTAAKYNWQKNIYKMRKILNEQ